MLTCSYIDSLNHISAVSGQPHLHAAAIDQLTAGNHVTKHHTSLLALVNANGIALALDLWQQQQHP